MAHYDIFGDPHGHKRTTLRMLEKLGYEKSGASFRHDGRRAVFVGDLMDRGPDPIGLADLALAMVAAGDALWIMGNHEFNTVAISTEDRRKPGAYLRRRSEQHLRQSRATLDQLDARADRPQLVDALRRLPILHETADEVFVHACPDRAALAALQQGFAEETDGVWRLNPAYEAWERLTSFDSVGDARSLVLCGPEYDLPAGQALVDPEGNRRAKDRLAWWKQARQPKPTFFGHYNMARENLVHPETNAVCVDAGCGLGGPLAVYRHTTGAPLDPRHLVFVESDEV